MLHRGRFRTHCIWFDFLSTTWRWCLPCRVLCTGKCCCWGYSCWRRIMGSPNFSFAVVWTLQEPRSRMEKGCQGSKGDCDRGCGRCIGTLFHWCSLWCSGRFIESFGVVWVRCFARYLWDICRGSCGRITVRI